MADKQFGQLLVDKGVITSEQLATALSRQSAMPFRIYKIGETVVRLGFADNSKVNESLIEQGLTPNQEPAPHFKRQVFHRAE